MERLNVMDAVPGDALMILQSQNFQETFQKLKKSKAWSQLLSNKEFKSFENKLDFTDSLISGHPEFASFLSAQPVNMSIHRTGGKDFDFLFSFTTADMNPESKMTQIVNAILKDKIPIAKRLFENITIIEIPLTINGRSVVFSYATLNGIVAASFSGSLLEACLRQIKNPSRGKDKILQKLMYTAGSNVDANIYINYKYFTSFLMQFFKPEYAALLKEMNDFSKWTEMDFKIKDNSINLNGLTITDSLSTFMDCFLGQQPQRMNVAKVLPYSTSCFMYWGLSDFMKYYRTYKKYISTAPVSSLKYKNSVLRNALLSNLSTSYKINVEEKMLGWIGNEFAFAMLEPSDSLVDNTFAVFQTRNITQAQRSLTELQTASNGDTLEIYNGCAIGQVNAKDLLSRLLGSTFSSLHNTYYAILENYVIFGNSEKALHYFINENIAQRVLSREESFQNFVLNFSDKSSFCLFGDVQKGLPALKEFVNDSLARIINKYPSDFMKFSGIGIQYIADEQMSGFFTNFTLGNAFKSRNVEEVDQVWKTELDNPISSAPQFVKNHRSGENEIIVQDDENKLYLLNMKGEILWSRQLPSKIQSHIYQVDAFKNNHFQYLFNTKNGLYLIDHDGNNVNKFPVKFPSSASNALAVFDYDHTRDYRVYIGFENGQVGVFQADGKPVTGWKFTNPIWPTKVPLEHFSINDKDYLILCDSKGATYILDRKGEKIAIADKPLFRAKNNHLTMDMADQPYLITTDTAGNIFNLYLNGSTEVEHISRYKPEHYFECADLNGDKLKDYIFLNQNYLFVCNQDTSKIFDYTFPDNASSSLSLRLFNLSDQTCIAVSSVSNNKVYLFNRDGTLRKGFPVAGSTQTEMAEVALPGRSRSVQYLLAGSKDANLYLYSLH